MMSSLNPWDLAAICCGYWHLGQTPLTISQGLKLIPIKSTQTNYLLL